LFVILTSPDARKDTLYLSNFASIHLRDELARLPEMANVTLFGEKEYALRIWLDPDRLAAYALTAEDVTRTRRELDGGKRRKSATPEELGSVAIKTTDRGAPVRLKDVGRVELGSAGTTVDARFDGKPAVAIGLSAWSQTNERK